MPKDIATFLKLLNVEEYTGHSFRRTSATLLVDAGADLLTLQRHGGWISSTVAYGYIANSLNNKKTICNQISSGLAIKNQATITDSSNVKIIQSTSRSLTAPAQATSSSNETQRVIEKHVRNSEAPNTIVSSQLHHIESRSLLPTKIHHKQISDPYDEPEIKRPVFYHPDIGLHFQDNDEVQDKTFIFQNCNVTINNMCILQI